MNFDGLYRFGFADFCIEVVIYRYYYKNRRLISINLPFFIEIAIHRPNLGDFDDIGRRMLYKYLKSSTSVHFF